MNQSSRINSLEEFKNGLADILVASDVAARGLDIAGLSHVFNYDVPNNPEDYVHRIGRTGRAGLSGKAFTLYDDSDEKSILMIEKLIKKKINIYSFEDILVKPQTQTISTIERKTPYQKNSLKDHKINLGIPPIENFVSFKESGQIPSFLINK